MNLSGLTLRVTEDQEDKGIDPSEIGYFAYDYITQDEDVPVNGEENSRWSMRIPFSEQENPLLSLIPDNSPDDLDENRT